MKKFWVCGLAAALSAMLIMPSHAGEWVQDTSRAANDNGLSNWWYRNADGTYPANGWFWIDSDGDGLAEGYCFNEAGWMYVDTVIDGYIVDASGMWILDGVVQRKPVEPALDHTGEYQNNAGMNRDSAKENNNTGSKDRDESGTYDGNSTPDDDYYDSTSDASDGNGSNSTDRYPSDKTKPRNEWHTDEYGRQYFDENGDPVSGWKKIDGSTYYFDEAGYALTGYQEVDGWNYYFYHDGERAENTVHSRENGVYYVVVRKEFYVLDVIAESEWEDYKRDADRSMVEITKITDENKAEDRQDTTDETFRYDEGLNDEMAIECFNLVNEERIRAGIEPLVYNEAVMEACRIRASELAEKFSHTRPDGSPCFTVFDEVDLLYYEAGENIAAGMNTPKEAVSAWMESPNHKRNILTKEYTDGAIGCYVENGSQYKVYWIQMFCNPR